MKYLETESTDLILKIYEINFLMKSFIEINYVIYCNVYKLRALC